MAKVCVAMSGGVDSTTTAYLLKMAGHEVFGLTMYLFDIEDETGQVVKPGFLEDARRVALELEIHHEIIDLRAVFKQVIIEPFIHGYRQGITPNPCAVCNAKIKYGYFMDEALKRGADYLATGHYVRLLRHEDGLIHLHEGHTFRKDQSYFLYGLSQERLEKLMLPLGEYENKSEIREMAAKFRSSVAEKKDSLGICFTQGKPPEQYLKATLGSQYGKGSVKDNTGTVVGYHEGYYKFTRGQKKGFNLFEPYKLSHKHMAIQSIQPADGCLVIAPEASLYSKALKLTDLHWIHQPDVMPYQGEFKIFAWGYRLKGTIHQLNDREHLVIFDEPVRAIAVGQACVVYRGDEILGGGLITDFMN